MQNVKVSDRVAVVIEFVEREGKEKTGGGRVIVGQIDKEMLDRVSKAGHLESQDLVVADANGIQLLVENLVKKIKSRLVDK